MKDTVLYVKQLDFSLVQSRGRQPFPSRRPETSCKIWRAVLIFYQQFRSLCCLWCC